MSRYPSFLLLIGVLLFWDGLRIKTGVRSVMAGVNAAVGGLLLAALNTPVRTGAIHAPLDVAIAAVAFVRLAKIVVALAL